MVLWQSGKNATLFVHVMCPGAQCSILDVVTIFDYIYIMVIPRGSGILTISIRIPWKKVGISMELETKMAEAPANCFPSKFHGILWNSDFPLRIWQNLQELMEEGKDFLSCVLLMSYVLLKVVSCCCCWVVLCCCQALVVTCWSNVTNNDRCHHSSSTC